MSNEEARVEDDPTAVGADGSDDSDSDGRADDARPPQDSSAADSAAEGSGAQEPMSAEGSEGKNAKKKDKKESSGSFWKELPILIAVALVLAFIVKTWVVQAFFIPSQSMEDTLLVGDRVLVSKVTYQFRDIERGDVVVFNGNDSWDEDTVVAEPEASNPVAGAFTWVGQTLGLTPTGKDYIKRVIGLPGDTVECCDDEGRLLVNGEPLDEPYLYPDSLATHMEFEPVSVEEGRLWVMGDHRAISYDSRTHQGDTGGGTISEESVVGHAFVTVWPLNRIGSLSE